MKMHFFKIFWLIFAVFVAIFVISMGYSAYGYYKAIHADDPIDPYLLVDVGSARIVRGNITIQLDASEKYHIQEKDTIMVHSESESTIFWPDHSTTQLGADSTFAIVKMQVADDYSKIEIEATLLEGKIYTNMIRTLYPGSKMTVNVPRHNIVAGVRGTEFSLNLDKNYIHSIDHAVMLEKVGIFGKNSLLLPGEIAKADDIFARVWKEILDQIWEDAVILKKNAYEAIHAEKMLSAWEKLKWNLTQNDYWDAFVRWVLSFFEAFEKLEISEKIASLDAKKILEIPATELQKIYQNLKIWDFALERDVIRGAMFELSQADKTVQGWLETLASESLWDKVQFSTLDLKNSEKILDDFGKKMTIDMDVILQKMSEKNYGEEMMQSLENLFSVDFWK